jgi:hypothetical protein
VELGANALDSLAVEAKVEQNTTQFFALLDSPRKAEAGSTQMQHQVEHGHDSKGYHGMTEWSGRSLN